MDILVTILLNVVIASALTSILVLFIQSKRNGGKEVPWEKIRPILSEMFIDCIALMQAQSTGYKGVEDYAVAFVKRKISTADFLSKEEKEMLSEDFIRAIIAPRLKELHSKEFSMKRIGEQK